MRIPNPAFDYDQQKPPYAQHRQTDPRIAALLWQALGDAQTVLNVGAGTGSYEPNDRYVVAVEPSATMRAERIRLGRKPAVAGQVSQLPWDDNSFDASMALATVHHWHNIPQGLHELRRVTRGRILLFTADPDCLRQFWSAHYFPELLEVEERRFPRLDHLISSLGGSTEILPIPIPLDCLDGFQDAFYGRPEAFLQPEIRRAQSAWGFLPQGAETQMVEKLANDLHSGEWDRRFGHWRTQPVFNGSLRLLVNLP